MVPKATAVVMALKITALVRLDCSKAGMSGTPRHDVIDLERDADAEQQGKCDDICKIARKTVQHANLEGNTAGDQERDELKEHVRQSSKRDQHRNGTVSESEEWGFEKNPCVGSSDFLRPEAV